MTRAHNSRCTRPRSNAMDWQLRPTVGVDVSQEMHAELDGMPQLEREMKLAQFVTIMKMAARGDLHPDSADIGPIRRNPTLFELRWDFGRALYRLVHAEPAHMPNHLIGLRFHLKSLEGSDQEIRDAQDQEVSLAKVRYLAGRGTNWGVA